ncbi:MAG: hypothetical protein ACK4UO_00730 [Pseudolabrys sp.]
MSVEVPVARADAVRAINQRWLLKLWQRHLGEHHVPQWQSVEAENLVKISATLSLLDVTATASGTRYLIRYHGATIGEVYGSSNCRGRFLDEIIPRERCAIALAPYNHAVKAGRPVYTIHDVKDRDKRVVHFERLLLPFGRDGQGVDRVLASFEFVCPDGAFTAAGLLSAQIEPPNLRFCAEIDAKPR